MLRSKRMCWMDSSLLSQNMWEMASDLQGHEMLTRPAIFCDFTQKNKTVTEYVRTKGTVLALSNEEQVL
uniref:Uncharacterized protein n=1 Tax=Rhizophora mucronata TaxID=61149 RepID=A0A2P2NLM7_RHIMU